MSTSAKPGRCITSALTSHRQTSLTDSERLEVLDLEQLIYDFWNQKSESMPKDFKLPQGLLNCTGENDECGADPRDTRIILCLWSCLVGGGGAMK